MHTVDLLEQSLQVARRLGYDVRQEWVGTGGGLCEFRGRRRLFVDLAQSVLEQLGQVREVLRDDPRLDREALSPEMQRLLQPRRLAA